MRVAYMREFIFDFVCLPSCSQYPEADGSDESTCRLGPGVKDRKKIETTAAATQANT